MEELHHRSTKRYILLKLNATNLLKVGLGRGLAILTQKLSFHFILKMMDLEGDFK